MSADQKVYIRTVGTVAAIALLTFGGSALYDNIAGGPDARQAAVNAEEVLDGFKDQQQRAECVTSYVNADVASEAILLLAFGEVIQSAIGDGPIPPEQATELSNARERRKLYLVLRSQTNEKCDPTQPGGPQPLPPESYPLIESES